MTAAHRLRAEPDEEDDDELLDRGAERALELEPEEDRGADDALGADLEDGAERTDGEGLYGRELDERGDDR